MKKVIMKPERVSLEYFAVSSMKQYDLCFQLIDQEKCKKVCNHKEVLKTNMLGYTDNIVGVSLYHVVSFDSMNHFSRTVVPQYSKIEILQEGEICIKLAKKLKIPKGQKLYFNIQTGKITWQKTLIKYGKAVSSQNPDGFLDVKINF